MFLWVTSAYRHTRAKAWMMDSLWVSALCLHGKVLVADGLHGQPTSTYHTLHFEYPASFPTHFRITNCLQTRPHSFNKLDSSCPSLVSSASKVLSRIWVFYFLTSPYPGAQLTYQTVLGTCPISKAPDPNQKRLLSTHRGCSFHLGLHNWTWAC